MTPQWQKYVLGLMFDYERTQVALIKKNRPEWQNGYWNGIGGKVEPGEDPQTAMVREFEEETGMDTPYNIWDHYASVRGDWGVVHIYRGFMAGPSVRSVETVEDEEVDVFWLDGLPTKLQSNLKWLIPLAVHSQAYLPIVAEDRW